MSFNTIVTYTADGSTNAYAVPFSYLKEDHVYMYLDGVEDTTFTFLTASSVAATSTPGAGVQVLIKRITPSNALDTVIPNSGTFRGTDINNQSLQALYVAEEGYDALVNVLSLDTTDDTWDAQSKVIKNVATPTAASHAARKDYVDAVAGSATAAAASAAAAAASQTAAAASASSASTDATAAAASASAASTSETNAGTSASNAATSASAAATSASNASTSATAAAASQTAAGTSETNAATSASNAASSETAAASSASSASDDAGYAQEWAIKAEDSLISVAAGGNGTTDYSSLHHAAKAAASATAAAVFDPANYVAVAGDTMTGDLTMSNNSQITFGTQIGTAVNDFSRHIELYTSLYGINVTSGNLNISSAGSSNINFAEGSAVKVAIDHLDDEVTFSDYNLITEGNVLAGTIQHEPQVRETITLWRDDNSFTTDYATDDKLDVTAHPYVNGDMVYVESTGTLPTGLSADTPYYVINAAANDFELSTTFGGSAVDINTSDGTGTHTVYKPVRMISTTTDVESDGSVVIKSGSVYTVV